MSTLSIAPHFPFARVKVVRQTVHAEAGAALVHLEPDRRFRPRCHGCGRRALTVHSQGHCRLVRDLSLAATQVWLRVAYRKVWCRWCGGVRVEDLSFARPGRRVTDRLARYIYDLCREMTVEAVARHLDLDPKTVRAIEKAGLEAEFGRTDTAGLRLLAIDEVALKKGHQYMTVVLDQETGRVVWMGEGRTEQTLDAFFAGMSDARKAAIEAVALDLWDPYIKAVRRHLPGARIVFDLFHLVKGFGEVIKAVRNDEFLEARDQDRRVFQGTHYLLLKNGGSLSPSERLRLDDLLRINARLNTLYILKDQLKAIYRERFLFRVRRALDDWVAMASRIDHPLMRAFLRRLERYAYGILNHGLYPIGTSRLEGVNNTIKVLKRRAYGYHDPRHFALKVKQAFPGKNHD
jgi:transposase